MSRDHYIPQFILRGFAIDDSLPKDKQEIRILDTKTLEVETTLIGNAFMKIDCNTEETETSFAQNFETPMGNVLQQIKNAIRKNQNQVELKKSAYQKLFRFLVLMWRRNIVQLKKMEEYASILGEFFDGDRPLGANESPFAQYFEANKDICAKAFYDIIIKQTTNDDDTVKKTILNYRPIVIHNTSNVHFIVHNTYSTLNYCCQSYDQISTTDMPPIMIFPLSKNICLYLLLREQPLQLNNAQYPIAIETWDNPNDIEQFMIDRYIQPTSESIVVDNTNLQYVLNKLKN